MHIKLWSMDIMSILTTVCGTINIHDVSGAAFSLRFSLQRRQYFRIQSVESQYELWIMNWKGLGRRWSWYILYDCHGICLGGGGGGWGIPQKTTVSVPARFESSTSRIQVYSVTTILTCSAEVGFTSSFKWCILIILTCHWCSFC
jgi:hypothetical protein